MDDRAEAAGVEYMDCCSTMDCGQCTATVNGHGPDFSLSASSSTSTMAVVVPSSTEISDAGRSMHSMKIPYEFGDPAARRLGTEQLIFKELQEVQRRCEGEIGGSTLITCVKEQVQVRLRTTEYRMVVMCIQFPQDYPDNPILIELKSKTLDDKLLLHLLSLCEQESGRCKGTTHVLHMIKFLKRFLDCNPLCVATNEVKYIKTNLIGKSDELKIKQKQGILTFRTKLGQYFFDFRLTVPENYPLDGVVIEELSSNFPTDVKKTFIGNAIEISRRCVTPPIKQKPKDPPFKPKPSLQEVAEFIIRDCVKRHPTEVCPLCRRQAFPCDPAKIISNPESDDFVERVYCGHLYHHKCLDKYMTTPPFKDGKKCPPPCDKTIFHERWKATPRLAEARWAHHQARQRELSEVVDFLQ